jgi:DNA-directed RNA polymerase subunit M
MEFCPKCGSVIMGKNCARCNYKRETNIKLESSQKITAKKGVECVNEADSEVRPIINTPCKKCENQQAYFWSVQMRSGDEAETRFFKCTKCKHQWREYR